MSAYLEGVNYYLLVITMFAGLFLLLLAYALHDQIKLNDHFRQEQARLRKTIDEMRSKLFDRNPSDGRPRLHDLAALTEEEAESMRQAWEAQHPMLVQTWPVTTGTFCNYCPDHEACMSGLSCSQVKDAVDTGQLSLLGDDTLAMLAG